MSGFVSFVSSGPGDPELLTLKAVDRLRRADAVLFDDLASGPILSHVRAEADLVGVGKRAGQASPKQEHVSRLLVDYAGRGRVVRLKSGDAGLFGRLEEELAALRLAGIAHEIIPGVPSACAAAAAAGIPLTRRLTARRVQFVTGAGTDGALPADLNRAALADPEATTVVFMGARTFPLLAAQLIAAGLPAGTPALLAEAIGHPEQRLERDTVGGLAEKLARRPAPRAPVLILYGPLAEATPVIELALIGIGTGDPDHLTRQAIHALRRAELVLIPLKGAEKVELAEVRQRICAEFVGDPASRVVAFEVPERAASSNYLDDVRVWHDAIAEAWITTIRAHLPRGGRVALLIWGDPSLYDSSLRIADRVARVLPLTLSVIPGITAIQMLCAAHAISLTELGAPALVTTGRRLRAEGWPAEADTLVVMLDGACAFSTLRPEGVTIWWGAYLGMPGQLIDSGPLAEAGPRVIAARAAARSSHGWIMDIYLLRRSREPDRLPVSDPSATSDAT